MSCTAGSDTFSIQMCTQWHYYLREEECTNGERGREDINTQQTKAKETRREGLKCIIPSCTGAKNVLPQTPYNYCDLGYTQPLLIPHSLLGG